MNSALKELMWETDTNEHDWVQIDGPETGVGIERWYKNVETGDVVYVVDDQGDIMLSFGDDDESVDMTI